MHERTLPLMLLASLLVGCADDTQSLLTIQGETIEFAEVSCIYRETFGCDQYLELQLRFEDAAGSAVWETFVYGLSAGSPAVLVPGEVTRFEVGTWRDGANFSSALGPGEARITLDDLPAPDTLREEDPVDISGTYDILDALVLPETPPGGEPGRSELDVPAQSFSFQCRSFFSRSECVF